MDDKLYEQQVLRGLENKLYALPVSKWTRSVEGPDASHVTTSYEFAQADYQFITSCYVHKWSSSGKDSTDEWVTDEYESNTYVLKVQRASKKLLILSRELGRCFEHPGPDTEIAQRVYDHISANVDSYLNKLQDTKYRREQTRLKRIEDKRLVQEAKKHKIALSSVDVLVKQL